MVRGGLSGFLGRCGLGALGDDGFDTSDLTADVLETCWIFKLAALLLNAQVQGFLLELTAAGRKLFDAGFTEFFDFHDVFSVRGFAGRRFLFVEGFAGDKAAADADFVGCEAAGFAGGCFIDAGDFEHHVAWEHHCDPELWSAFTFTHSDFWWALGDWLVWEDADEDLTFTLEEAGEGHTAGFDLVVFDPAAIKKLQTVVAEVELVAAGGIASAVAALLLAVFGSAGE